MQDTIQKLWSNSVEVEGIAASMVLRKTDIQYISSSLSILKSKIAELDSIVNSIQLDYNDNDECDQPVGLPSLPQKPLYREILKETIFIESSHQEPTECNVEPQQADELPEENLPEITPAVYNPFANITETPEPQDEPELELPQETEPEQEEEQPIEPEPEVARPVLDSSIVDEDIRDEQSSNTYNYSDVAIEPDPDTEPAIEEEPEFEPVLDPEPEPEPKPEPEQPVEPVESAEPEQTVESTSIDQAVESEEHLEESIAQQITEIENPEAALSQEEPIKADIQPELPEGEADHDSIEINSETTQPEESQPINEPAADDQAADEAQSIQQPRGESEPEGPISVDQKLSRKISKNFRQAISLNDKFCFRRELFGNSSQQYDAALDLIAEMSSFEETRDYFLDNYGWDADNDDVKSFFEILANHFNN